MLRKKRRRKRRRGENKVPLRPGHRRLRRGRGSPLNSQRANPGPARDPEKLPQKRERLPSTNPLHPPVKGDTEHWSVVVGRAATRAKLPRVALKAHPPRQPNPRKLGGSPPPPSPRRGLTHPPPAQGKKGRRLPRTAAVVITYPPGGYKGNLKLAVKEIDLASLGIERMGARRAVTGAYIFEIGQARPTPWPSA